MKKIRRSFFVAKSSRQFIIRADWLIGMNLSRAYTIRARQASYEKFGNMPDEMKNGSHLFGVELDSITGRIETKTFYGNSSIAPGGVVAVITSRGTLDKQDSSARKYFARRADLIRAVRLPNNVSKMRELK